MTVKAPQRDRADVTALSRYRNPVTSNPLPGGLTPDATYMSFLRGAGADYMTAYNTALANMANARAAFNTTASRVPFDRQRAIEQVDDDTGERGVWASGERLKREAEQRVLAQRTLDDAAATRASGLSSAAQNFGATVGQLNRGVGEATGQLQDRTSAYDNQNRYIAAVSHANDVAAGAAASAAAARNAALNSFSSSLGGGTMPGGPAPAPATPPGSLPFPKYDETVPRGHYYGSLNPTQQGDFSNFLSLASGGKDKPNVALYNWLSADPRIKNPAYDVAARAGGALQGLL